MTPGQLLHRLHSLDSEGQMDLAGRILESQEAASRCFVHNHDARIAEWDERVQQLLWQRDGVRVIADHFARECDRLRREVEFEAKGANPSRLFFEVSKPSLRAEIERLMVLDATGTEPQPVCACVSDEQAAALDPKWKGPGPVCAVHPESREEDEERSGRVVSGQASREETAGKTLGRGLTTSGAPGPGDGTATPAPSSSRAVLPYGGEQ
jgi:hypothetical protein